MLGSKANSLPEVPEFLLEVSSRELGADGTRTDALLCWPGLCPAHHGPSLLTSRSMEPWLTTSRRRLGGEKGVKARACLGMGMGPGVLAGAGVAVQARLRPCGSGPPGPRKAAHNAGPSASPAGGPSGLGRPDLGPPGPPPAGSSGGHSLPTGVERHGQHGERGVPGLAGAWGVGAFWGAPGAGAEAATGARGVRHRGGQRRAGGTGAGRQLWRPRGRGRDRAAV